MAGVHAVAPGARAGTTRWHPGAKSPMGAEPVYLLIALGGWVDHQEFVADGGPR